MARLKNAMQAGLVALLLETLPVEGKETLLTFQEMLQNAQGKEEKLKEQIRLYIYIRVLAEAEIISETESDTLQAYFIPDF